MYLISFKALNKTLFHIVLLSQLVTEDFKTSALLNQRIILYLLIFLILQVFS